MFLKMSVEYPQRSLWNLNRDENQNLFLSLGYRDGGNNMRKYKLTPTHLPHPTALYHKHNVQRMHSPLHESGFTVHSRSSSHSVVRPPPVSRVESPKPLDLQHQSTPLARLSPSSELSQQMPRILTLQVSVCCFNHSATKSSMIFLKLF